MGNLHDSLQAVFDSQVIQRWAANSSKLPSLQYRIDVVTASGPYPADPHLRERVRRFRAQRAAWEAYLDAAFACGMFSGDEGESLRARLTGTDESNFRAAMAECMACWYLAGKFGFNVAPNPPGRNNCVLDFHVQTSTEELVAEVKAPNRDRPEDGWWADDTCGMNAELYRPCKAVCGGDT